jgi:hypothetical protein
MIQNFWTGGLTGHLRSLLHSLSILLDGYCKSMQRENEGNIVSKKHSYLVSLTVMRTSSKQNDLKPNRTVKMVHSYGLAAAAPLHLSIINLTSIALVPINYFGDDIPR